MDVILDILLDLVLDGAVEVANSKTAPRWLRRIVGGTLAALYAALVVGLLWFGARDQNLAVFLCGLAVLGLGAWSGIRKWSKSRR